MKQFKDFGIKIPSQNFVGDKIKMNRILNREIVVFDYKLEDSKFANCKSKCLYLQIAIGETKHVVFTISQFLTKAIQEVPKKDFPFTTTIVEDNKRLEFS